MVTRSQFEPLLTVPGARLLGAAPIASAVLIAFNVFYLRPRHPGWLSGKLSDLGINFFLPVLLLASSEWLVFLYQFARHRPFRWLGTRWSVAACVVSGNYFFLLKAAPAFTVFHVALLAFVGRLFGFEGTFHNTADPSDLLTLAATPLAFIYQRAALRNMH